MGFFTPWFLAGLAAAGIPIYFHLLRRHRSVPKPFSSLMFFERTTQSSIKHRRLRYWKLLALRLALLILLALAFAGPYVLEEAFGPGSARRLVVLVIDNSFSMRAEGRLERAKQEARSVLDGLPAGAEVQVAALADRLEFQTLPTSDRGELAAAIDAIQASDARSSYGELARALRAAAETARMPLEVHFFSDLQQSSMPPSFVDLQLAPSTRFLLHPAADDLAPNFAVESVHAPAKIFRQAQAAVQATIAGFGTEAATIPVTLSVNGKRVETLEAQVPANGRATVEFRSFEAAYGFNRCEVSIDAADALADDNRYLFAIERSDPEEALFLHRRRGGRDLVYFRAALEASRNAAFRLQPVEIARAGTIDPARFSVVVLSDPGALPAGLERSLEQYLRLGGGLLIAAGSATARTGRIPVADLPVLEARYASRQGERFFLAGHSDSSHPAVAVENLWDGVKFYLTVGLDPANVRTVTRLAGGGPLLVEKAVGEGRALIFASTFDNVANDFPLHPGFVAFVERTMNYLGGVDTRTSVKRVGDFADLRTSGAQGQVVEVIGPDGRRELSLTEAAAAASFELTRTGFYEFRRPNGRNEMVAVNADRRESSLAVVPEETRRLWENTGEGTVEAGPTGGTNRRPRPLWWYVLLLALAAAVAESLVAARYLAVERGTA